jgi:hypothetical protein
MPVQLYVSREQLMKERSVLDSLVTYLARRRKGRSPVQLCESREVSKGGIGFG